MVTLGLLDARRKHQRWTLAGEQSKVDRGNLFRDLDYPVLNEYRAVFGGLFATLWGLSLDQVQKIFPDSSPADLKLV